MADIETPDLRRGRCLCGSVVYELIGPVRTVQACHCSQCRRQSGHFVVAGEIDKRQFFLCEGETLAWFASSEYAKRGYCARCGSALFWDDGGETLSFNVGSLDDPTGLHIQRHIFVADKGDYYEIDDDLPKFDSYPEDEIE